MLIKTHLRVIRMTDYTGGVWVTYYPVDEILAHLRLNPQLILENNKKAVELLAGCVLARSFENKTKRPVDIAYVLRNRDRHHPLPKMPPVKELISNDSLVVDSDVDLYIGNEDSKKAFQITRLVLRESESSAVDRLEGLIQRKCLIQADPNLSLAVLNDETFDLECDRLKAFLRSLNIPYASIYLIAKLGLEPQPGQFRCIRIYPDWQELEPVNINLDY